MVQFECNRYVVAGVTSFLVLAVVGIGLGIYLGTTNSQNPGPMSNNSHFWWDNSPSPITEADLVGTELNHTGEHNLT